ncbi:thiamine pyrophosphate-dependent enzyme [Nitrosopumilus sp. S4]
MGEDKISKTTAEILIDSLSDWGVKVIFGIPGDGINGVMEAIRTHDDMRFILTRHEQAAAFMACAYSKYSKQLGVCLATTGPGATNLLTGLYDAKADNTPVLAITGSTYSDLIGSSYQQDVNVLELFSDVSEYNNRINKPEHAEMVTDIACRTAISRKGVSHISIPIDVQYTKTKNNFSPHKTKNHTSDYKTSISVPSIQEISKACDLLNSKNKIVILVGQGTLHARKEIKRLAETLQAPVVKALLGKAVLPDDSEFSLGGLGMLGTEPASKAMNDADLILLIGTSFPYHEYLPDPKKTIGIQIDINPEKIGLRYPVKIGLVGDSKSIINLILKQIKEKSNSDFLSKLQKEMNDWKTVLKKRSSSKSNPIKPQAFTAMLSEHLDSDAIISVDSGTNTSWAARYLDMQENMEFSASGTLSSMACALPYSIAAKIAFPDRQSIAFVGDGGLGMMPGDFSTAVKYKLPIKVFVIKNSILGMIRWEQIAFSGNPEFGIDFSPIDYAKFAEACGGKGFTIKKYKEMKKTIVQALKFPGPVIVDVFVDPYEPPLPPDIHLNYLQNIVKSLAKGQPHGAKIAMSLINNKVKEIMTKK